MISNPRNRLDGQAYNKPTSLITATVTAYLPSEVPSIGRYKFYKNNAVYEHQRIRETEICLKVKNCDSSGKLIAFSDISQIRGPNKYEIMRMLDFAGIAMYDVSTPSTVVTRGKDILQEYGIYIKGGPHQKVNDTHEVIKPGDFLYWDIPDDNEPETKNNRIVTKLRPFDKDAKAMSGRNYRNNLLKLLDMKNDKFSDGDLNAIETAAVMMEEQIYVIVTIAIKTMVESGVLEIKDVDRGLGSTLPSEKVKEIYELIKGNEYSQNSKFITELCDVKSSKNYPRELKVARSILFENIINSVDGICDERNRIVARAISGAKPGGFYDMFLF